MKTFRSRSRLNGHCSRSGSAAVEAAVVLPLLLFVTLGSIDVAQYINLSQTVSNSSREAARIASRDATITTTTIESAVEQYFTEAFPNQSSTHRSQNLTIAITDKNGYTISGGALAAVPSGDPISVRVQFDFDSIRWLGGASYFGDGFNHSTTTSRRE